MALAVLVVAARAVQAEIGRVGGRLQQVNERVGDRVAVEAVDDIDVGARATDRSLCSRADARGTLQSAVDALVNDNLDLLQLHAASGDDVGVQHGDGRRRVPEVRLGEEARRVVPGGTERVDHATNQLRLGRSGCVVQRGEQDLLERHVVGGVEADHGDRDVQGREVGERILRRLGIAIDVKLSSRVVRALEQVARGVHGAAHKVDRLDAIPERRRDVVCRLEHLGDRRERTSAQECHLLACGQRVDQRYQCVDRCGVIVRIDLGVVDARALGQIRALTKLRVGVHPAARSSGDSGAVLLNGRRAVGANRRSLVVQRIVRAGKDGDVRAAVHEHVVVPVVERGTRVGPGVALGVDREQLGIRALHQDVEADTVIKVAAVGEEDDVLRVGCAIELADNRRHKTTAVASECHCDQSREDNSNQKSDGNRPTHVVGRKRRKVSTPDKIPITDCFCWLVFNT